MPLSPTCGPGRQNKSLECWMGISLKLHNAFYNETVECTVGDGR